jgi:hypothetical protein
MIIAVAVAVPALPLAAGVAWLLSPEQVRLRSLINAYNAKAEHHEELELNFTDLSKFQEFSKAHGSAIRDGQLVHFLVGQRPELIPRYRELSKYHGALRRKYENAAWHPRLPVEPDPPEPEP